MSASRGTPPSLLHRRRLLQVGGVGLTGLSLASSLRAAGVSSATAASPHAKAVLLIYLDGGPSHINLFDLKPDVPSEIRGPYRPIATSVPGLTIGELLPRVAQ